MRSFQRFRTCFSAYVALHQQHPPEGGMRCRSARGLQEACEFHGGSKYNGRSKEEVAACMSSLLPCLWLCPQTIVGRGPPITTHKLLNGPRALAEQHPTLTSRRLLGLQAQQERRAGIACLQVCCCSIVRFSPLPGCGSLCRVPEVSE
jgi:hypothetical protein